jgi:hypothetical protein
MLAAMRIAIAAALIGAAAPLWAAGWVPPAQPDPVAILKQAKADAAARRYEDALAEQVWFHQHALDYAQGLYGVRLSYALRQWMVLAKVYPPAFLKLEAARDAAADHVRRGDGARGYFNEVVAMDRVLGQDAATRQLFVWLDANRNETAGQVYDIAQASLVRGQDYALCGKYLQPQKALQRIVDQYRLMTQLAETDEHPDRAQTFAQKTLVNKTGLLVALLVQNHRKDEADAIAGEAIKEWNDPSFRQTLLEALAGEVPEPWPL